MDIDRTECARALAKSIAFRNIGKHDLADQWARTLFHLLMPARTAAPAPCVAPQPALRLVGSSRA
jgi:hypothetical protein